MFFFFSSRRRHTRYWRDWSSDVCSSDLVLERALPDAFEQGFGLVALGQEPARVGTGDLVDVYGGVYGAGEPFGGHEGLGQEGEDGRHAQPVAPRDRDELGERLSRSEERRVGKE